MPIPLRHTLKSGIELTVPLAFIDWVWVLCYDRRFSRPVCLEIKHPSGTYDQIWITVWQLRVCWCGALSLTRGRVCRLYMLLVLASGVFLGSESLGTRDHILLSQFWDFPFRHLLRLAGSRWRYSTRPPHVCPLLVLSSTHIYKVPALTA
jgi:hypothetical protein